MKARAPALGDSAALAKSLTLRILGMLRDKSAVVQMTIVVGIPAIVSETSGIPIDDMCKIAKEMQAASRARVAARRGASR